MPEYSTRAVSRVSEPKAQQTLGAALVQRQTNADVNIALAAAAIRLAWDPESAIFRFLDALASSSSYERELATVYVRRNTRRKLTFVMRRALAREGRESTRDRLRALLDKRR